MIRSRRAFLLSCLVAVLGWLAAPPAAADSWLPFGPPGGDVRALAADPGDARILYLGTADGLLYRSDDGGGRWRRLSPGFPKRDYSLDEIELDGRGHLYVGYWGVTGGGGGVARSADGGEHFDLLPGIEGESVRALSLAASDPRVLVAGTLRGVFRSDDGGDSWRRISPAGHPEIRNVESVAIDPARPDEIYVGTWHLPWKTLDGGRSWAPVHAGMITDSDVFTLTLDRRNPRTVFATACSGIYRSLDAAGHWAKIHGIPKSSRRTRCFAQDPSRPDTFYAGTTEGLWVTRDGTLNWQAATPKDVVVNAIVVQPGGTILLGCDGAGVLRSGDGGRTWLAANDGFSERFVSRIAFGRGSDRVLAAVVGDRQHGGVFAAPRLGGPWARLGEGLEGREVLSLAAWGTRAMAGTDDGLYLLEEGTGWRRLPATADGLDLHPRVTEVVALSDRLFLAASSVGLLRSFDGGDRWERRVLGAALGVTALTASSAQPGRVVAATSLGIYESGDGGGTWHVLSVTPGDGRIQALALLPGDENVVFAATSSGLLKSRNHGATWLRRGGGLPLSDITGLAQPPDGRVLFASDFSRGGVYRSDDAGDTWTRLTADGLGSDRVWSLAVDPDAPGRLLAAAPAGGIHVLATGPVLAPASH